MTFPALLRVLAEEGSSSEQLVTTFDPQSLRRDEHIHRGDVPRQIEDVLP